jgi:hypothetical protein
MTAIRSIREKFTVNDAEPSAANEPFILAVQEDKVKQRQNNRETELRIIFCFIL